MQTTWTQPSTVSVRVGFVLRSAEVHLVLFDLLPCIMVIPWCAQVFIYFAAKRHCFMTRMSLCLKQALKN